MIRFEIEFFVVGLLALLAGRFGLVERGLKVPVLKWFLLPYRLVEVGGVGRGIRSYLELMGWLFIGLSVVMVIANLFQRN